MLGLLKRPSFWTTIVALVAYCDWTALNGYWVYDDSGSTARNVVVTGDVPWTDAFTRDFWGTPMTEVASHKSFRPITTLTLKLNWWFCETYGYMEEGQVNPKLAQTLGFHLVNVGLHSVVTGLVTEVSAFFFDGGTQGDLIAQLITGLVFGLHPVHAEAVSNITSRGEMLMSLFFCLAFLSYANHIPSKMTETGEKKGSSGEEISYMIRQNFYIYIAPWFFMACSMFSKEQGVTTLIALVAFDFLTSIGSIRDFLAGLKKRDQHSLHFLKRTVVLAIETLVLVVLRVWLNGETKPDFIMDQNPAGFAEDRFTRIFSVNWVYCLYIYDMVYPKYLCPDWSGGSIALIEEHSDGRMFGPILIWVFVAWCLQSLYFGPRSDATLDQKQFRRILLIAFFSCTVSPFILSSNLLVVTGLMKADRVLYLPLLGFCVMEALVYKALCCDNDITQTKSSKQQVSVKSVRKSDGVRRIGHLIIMIQLFLFAQKTHERNQAWSHSVKLWSSAYDINPRSHHTMYNCGYELSLKQRYKEAEEVMRPIGSARVDGPSNTFVYAMILYNLDKTQEARAFINEALQVVEEQKITGGVRNRPGMTAKTESNLLVAKAFTQTRTNLREAGQTVYQAVKVDPQNQYAIQQAQQISKRLEEQQKYGYAV